MRSNVKIVGIIVLNGLLIAGAFAFPLDREIWIRDNTKSISRSFCDQSSYFRQCFLIDDNSCLNYSKAVVAYCMDEYRPQMPKILDIPYHDNKFRPWIGACAGNRYQAQLSDYLKNEESCAPTSEWKR